MPSLVKRGKFYSIVTTLPNGKRQWVSTKRSTKFEASQFVPSSISASHLSDLKIQASQLLRNTVSESTIENYTLALKHSIDLLGDKKLSDVSKKDVQYMQSTLLNNHAIETVNGHMRKMRAIYNYAIKWDMCSVNPFKGVKIFKTETKPRVMSIANVAKILKKVKDPYFKRLFVFGLYTGMRRGEIVNLRWEFWEDDHITLPSYITKSRKSRTILLNFTAKKILERHCPRTSAYVFTKDGKQIELDYLSKLFHQVAKKAGLRFRFHDLRHTFASWAVMNDVPLYDVKELLGHADIKTTSIYAKLNLEKLRDSVRKILPPKAAMMR